MMEVLSETIVESSRRIARDLAREGRYRDAVTLGKIVNRKQPDVGFSAELRDWRHRAYYEAAPIPGPSHWPPAYENPFPDIVHELPEVDAAELTVDLLGGVLANQGTLIVRQLFSPERMEALRGAVAKPLQPETRTAGHYDELVPVAGSLSELEMSRTLFPGVETNMPDAPVVLELWLAGLEECGVLDVVSAYLGEHPAISACKANLYCMPPLTTSVAWHQDGVVFGDDTRAVNVWVAANDCGVDAPGLEFVPVRLTEIVETGGQGSEHGWSISDRVANSVTSIPTARPVFSAGDAVMFEKYSLHRASALATMTKTRFALQSWLIAPSRYCSRIPGDEGPMLWI